MRRTQIQWECQGRDENNSKWQNPEWWSRAEEGHPLAQSVLLAEPHGARGHCPCPKCNQETDPGVSRERPSCSVGKLGCGIGEAVLGHNSTLGAILAFCCYCKKITPNTEAWNNINVKSYSSRAYRSKMSLTGLKRRCWQICLLSEGQFIPCLFHLPVFLPNIPRLMVSIC